MPVNEVKVGLARRENRRQNVFASLDLVRDEVIPKLQEQVMIKPNFLSGQNQFASTHIDAVWGVVDFLQTVPTPPQTIIVAEGGNEDVAGEAFRNFGYLDLVGQSPLPLQLVDLNQEENWVETSVILVDRREAMVGMSKTVLDCPCTISLALAKTHDTCVVTLALKNMIMGTIRKKDRVKMHGVGSHAERELPGGAQMMNINLIRLSRHLSPDIAVIDGTVGLQGNGPQGTDAVELGIAVASADVFAADAVMVKVMGFEPLELGWLHYGHALGYGIADLDRIKVLETAIEAVNKDFKPHEKTPLQLQWRLDNAMQYLNGGK